MLPTQDSHIQQEDDQWPATKTLSDSGVPNTNNENSPLSCEVINFYFSSVVSVYPGVWADFSPFTMSLTITLWCLVIVYRKGYVTRATYLLILKTF